MATSADKALEILKLLQAHNARSKKPEPKTEAESLDQEIESVSECGFYNEPLPKIISIIRTHQWAVAYKMKLIDRLLQKDPSALHAKGVHFLFKDNSPPDISVLYFQKERDRNPNVVFFITTPLHEAILKCEPQLVDFLCQKGAKINENPYLKTEPSKLGTYSPKELKLIKEYSYTPLDLALQPILPTRTREILFLPQITRILLQHGTRCQDGTVPKPISPEECRQMMTWFSSLLTKTHQEALASQKELVIFLPEYHGSRQCLFLEIIILIQARKLGLKRHYMEKNEANLALKRKYGIWNYFSDPTRPCKFSNKEYYTTDDTLVVTDALGMIPTPVDLSFDPSNDLLNPKNINARNKIMKETIESIDEGGVWVVGEAHFRGLLNQDKLNPDRFLVYPINICPASLPCDFARSQSVIQIPFKYEGRAEMMSGEDMIKVLSEVDPVFDQFISKHAGELIHTALKENCGVAEAFVPALVFQYYAGDAREKAPVYSPPAVEQRHSLNHADAKQAARLLKYQL